jgi:Fe-S cluster assembly protein SufD
MTRTKAEQGLIENFEAAAAKLPGGRVIGEARKAAIGAFAGLGLPHRRIEEWKYTDLRSALKVAPAPAIGAGVDVDRAQIDKALGPLAELDASRAVFVDGAYRPELSSTGGVKGLETGSLGTALSKSSEHAGEAMMRSGAPGQEAVIALNTAFMTDGALIRVAKGAEIAKPLLLVFARAGKEARLITTRNIVKVGERARATVIEVHVALPAATQGQANTLSEITVGDGAQLVHAKCTLEGAGVSHVASWIAKLGTRASYKAFQFTADSALVRNHILATFKGEGTKLDISGCFLGRDAEHIDTTLVVDHAVPGCQSRELFKGVLAGRARGIFQGKVIVRPDAQKTDGKQMAQVLMLSEDAEFDSKPELEIFADDVVCGHGSTAAEIDPDMLFYFRARGIPPEEARAMLIESFVGEALDKIDDEALREAIAKLAKGRLGSLTA